VHLPGAQAEVQGQTVTWLMPHCTGQVLPTDVDYRVMLTFLEFYHVLLKFVFFKLYHSLGLKYPPAVDPSAERAAAELAAIIQELSGAAGAEAGKREAAGGTGAAEAALSGELDAWVSCRHLEQDGFFQLFKQQTIQRCTCV
jgi:pescadillo